jgi:Cu(I)/Ag(I) efflux system membrane protein CusA/SilA
MPGWTNVWTMPIQNRVDMLATGVNTALGIRVLGRNLDDVVRTSEQIAAIVKRIPGAADVVADPLRGKQYLEIRIDRAAAARLGVSVAEVNDVIEAALGGKAVATVIEGRERHPIVVRYGRDWRQDEDAVRNLLVHVHREEAAGDGRPGQLPRQVPLSKLADVRIVEGPATIKGENGLLRNYVRLNVHGRGASDFVAEARKVVAEKVQPPYGTYWEWTGQFEHEIRARRTLMLVMPVVVTLIFLLLYWTYHDLADALLMMIAVPGAIAGGVFFQWVLGLKFSITVWVGYIACFGMATSTGIIMLVYLREAIARAGGIETMTLAELRQAVINGAVHRLRPKLLTEGTIVIGLAPMLWATGVGAEIIRPMAAPVLGGILVADEFIDLFLPVLFYGVRRWRWSRAQRAVGSLIEVAAP